jgi:hypothetical protein
MTLDEALRTVPCHRAGCAANGCLRVVPIRLPATHSVRSRSACLTPHRRRSPTTSRPPSTIRLLATGLTVSAPRSRRWPRQDKRWPTPGPT